MYNKTCFIAESFANIVHTAMAMRDPDVCDELGVKIGFFYACTPLILLFNVFLQSA